MASLARRNSQFQNSLVNAKGVSIKQYTTSSCIRGFWCSQRSRQIQNGKSSPLYFSCTTSSHSLVRSSGRLIGLYIMKQGRQNKQGIQGERQGRERQISGCVKVRHSVWLVVGRCMHRYPRIEVQVDFQGSLQPRHLIPRYWDGDVQMTLGGCLEMCHLGASKLWLLLVIACICQVPSCRQEAQGVGRSGREAKDDRRQ